MIDNSSFYKGDFAKKRMSVIHKKGQVTLFIVIAIVIVAVILFSYFYLASRFSEFGDNRPILDKCIESEIQKQIVDLSLTAGISNPSFTTMYMDENISILCYSNQYYTPCVVQYPFLKQTFENSLSKKMEQKIESCYSGALEDLRARGYDVTGGKMSYEISIDPGMIQVKMKVPTTVSDEDSSVSFKNFEIVSYSNLYDVLMVANSILQFETSYGDAEISSFMFYYPNLKIEKIRRDENIKIYTITNAEGIKYQFASRSYAWPAGYGTDD